MASNDYQGFIVGNRAKINRYLNRALWVFIITGPAIALGVAAGIFSHTDYGTCLGITLFVTALAAVHLAMVKLRPHSVLTSVVAIVAIEAIVVYMELSHVNIQLTWFLAPLLSILFCDRRLFFFALITNYLAMVGATWVTAPYYIAIGSPFETAQSYFFNMVAGCTIEMIIMAVAGHVAVKLSSDNIKELFRQQNLIAEHEQSAMERMGILDSMAEIYDNVNLISFVDNTEISLHDDNQEKHVIDMGKQTHTLMNQRLKEQVAPDHLDAFLTFTNITTVRERMKNKKIISADFIDVDSGWFRAQYITVDQAPDGMPDVVIYTTRNVDEEKRREERLTKLSMTDELTSLYNRRRYVEDLARHRDRPMKDDYVIFSIDVNGLKTVNDTKGHAAGDELIKGAADCLEQAVGKAGKVYRTGGDEFMAAVHTDAPQRLRAEIHKTAGEWHGTHSDKLNVAVGYASHAEHPDATVDDLEHMADADMYAEKDRYYRESGIDRRRPR